MTTPDAGRELDARVAEQVMGWKLFEVGYEGTEDETPEQRRYAKALAKQGDNAIGTYAYVGGGKVIAYENGFCGLFRPSTDIAAAWLVVEKLLAARNSGFGLRNHGTWTGEFTIGLRGFADDADTAPLAICRAALSACAPLVHGSGQ